MQRVLVTPRPNLDQRIKESAFDFASTRGQVYWDESAYYRFSSHQIKNDLEAASGELAALCLDFVGFAVRDEEILSRMGIPPEMCDLIAESWRKSDPSLYGRFDLAYDGQSHPKLLEYNADTPSALYETSVFQWFWLEDVIAQTLVPNTSDQFNSIHDALLETFSALKETFSLNTIHLACMMDAPEDRFLIAYLSDVAAQSGFSVTQLALADIGTTWDGPFIDLKNEPIQLLFKLYPWEWMWKDEFIRSGSMRTTRFLEPPWKAVRISCRLQPRSLHSLATFLSLEVGLFLTNLAGSGLEKINLSLLKILRDLFPTSSSINLMTDVSGVVACASCHSRLPLSSGNSGFSCELLQSA